MKRKLFIILLSSVCACALLFGLSACETKPGDDGSISQIVEITSVTLDSSAITLKIGESQTLEATVLPENASNKTVTWFSLDPTVAKVENGKVTALKKGVTSITAACGLKSANCIVTVTDSPAEEQKPGIAFDKTSFMMYVGDSQKINATVNIVGDGDKTLTWLSSDETVATVSGGTVKALKAGMSIIVATCGEYSASCTVTVAPVETTGVSLDKTAVTVYIGESVELKATVSPENATNKTVLWSSLDTSVVSIYNGRVTGVSAGSTVVTVLCASTTASFTATCVVTVLDGTVTGLTFDKTEHTVYIGDSFTLTPTIKPDYAKDKTVIWKSSDESIATVENGVVTALSEGEVIITGKAGEIEARCKVTVADPDPETDIEVAGENSVYIDEFGLANYKLKIIRQSGKTENIELTKEYFSSEDFEKLSTLGEHTIAVTYKSLNTQWKITIKNHDFEGVVFESETFLYDGKAKSLEVSGAPEGTEIVYENNGKSDLGEYTVTATLSKQYYNTKTLTAKLIIEFNNFDEAKLESQTFLYDGNKKSLEVTGVPAGTHIEYENNGQTEVGEYTVMATLEKAGYYRKTFTATLKIELKERNITYVLGYDDVTNDNPAKFNVALGLKLSAPVCANGDDDKGFGGWYADGAFQNKMNEIPAGTDEDITLYAKWEYPYEVDADGRVTGLTDYGKTLQHITIASEFNGVQITKIGGEAFLGCKNLISITISDNVTSIGMYAFDNCVNLTSVVLPVGITSIYHYTFLGCASLKDITIPNGVEYIYPSAFYGCRSLTEMIIPDSVTTIEQSAFENCTSLSSVTIGKSVETISEYAFRNSGLTEITIPASVMQIDGRAFNYCTKLASINVSGDNKVYHSDGDCLIETATKILIVGCNNSVIPTNGSVTKIGGYAFHGRGIQSVTIPQSVTVIGAYAFDKCKQLTEVHFEYSKWNYYTSSTDTQGTIIPQNYLESPSRAVEWIAGDRACYEWRTRN